MHLCLPSFYLNALGGLMGMDDLYILSIQNMVQDII